mmetsp:Transcript_38273/g.46150  ORF Transcript_38273/g.46150 Transcript_38273/m.46150 type:complete len:150 (+) Transcript_38273:21-470(+)
MNQVQVAASLAFVLLTVLIAYHGPLLSYIQVYGAHSEIKRGNFHSGDVSAKLKRAAPLPKRRKGEQDGTALAAEGTRSSTTRKKFHDVQLDDQVMVDICKERLRVINGIKGLSSRCRKVLLQYLETNPSAGKLAIEASDDEVLDDTAVE